jgi:hypothetical protein
VYGVLAIYLDNVVPNEMGVSRPMWYFLLPGYWMPQQVDSSKALTKVRGCVALGCCRWLQDEVERMPWAGCMVPQPNW